jgi:hypothetical protein
MAFFGFDQGQKENEIIAQEWLSLGTLWKTLPDGAEKSDIEGLIQKILDWKSGAEQWYALNKAEQAVGLVLPEPQLTTEFGILLAMAKSRELANFATHSTNAKLFDTSDGKIDMTEEAYP